MWKSLLVVSCFSAVILWGSVVGAVFQTTTAASNDASGRTALDTDPHLLGWWRLDDTSGKTAADSSKHERHGRLEGGISFDENSAAGRVGKAIELNGEEGVVIVIPDFKGVAGTHPRTVAVWIKTKRDRGQIIAWGTDDAGKMWELRFMRGHVGVTPAGGYLYINDQIDDGRWHHVVAVVHDGDPPNLHDHVTLYVDGTPAEIHDIGLLDVWPIDTGDEMDVTIGDGFRGLIDDVRIYDRGLSGEEVKALFGNE